MTGSRCSASPAMAVRPLARRIDSATRRAARAASTEPPQTTGLASASAMASILAGLTAMSRCGEHAIATRRAPRRPARGRRGGPRSTRSRYSSTSTAVASWSRPWSGRIVRPAARGVLGDQRVRRGGDDHLAAAADGLGDRGRRAHVAAVGGEHDDQVEPAGPAGQPRVRARRRTAPGTTARARRAAAGSRGRRRPRPGDGPARGRRRPPRRARTPPRRPRGVPAPRTRPGPQERVGDGQRGLVVEPRLVEPGGHVSRPAVSRACGPRRPAAPGCRRGRGRPARTRCTPAPRPLVDASAWQSGQTIISSSVGVDVHRCPS